jgi:hypothetical protein
MQIGRLETTQRESIKNAAHKKYFFDRQNSLFSMRHVKGWVWRDIISRAACTARNCEKTRGASTAAKWGAGVGLGLNVRPVMIAPRVAHLA